MNPFAIIVTIKLKPGTEDAFAPLILENAEASVRDEADCLQFQVLRSEDDPTVFHFYEVYADASALENHRGQPHYQKYLAATEEMVSEREIRRCNVLKT